MNGTSGLSAWRWLFILEGIPSLLSSVLVFFFLPDYPETVNWLSADERALAVQRLEKEGSHGGDAALDWRSVKEVLTEWRLYGHYAVSFVLLWMCKVSVADWNRYTSGYQCHFRVFRCLLRVLRPGWGSKT